MSIYSWVGIISFTYLVWRFSKWQKQSFTVSELRELTKEVDGLMYTYKFTIVFADGYVKKRYKGTINCHFNFNEEALFELLRLTTKSFLGQSNSGLMPFKYKMQEEDIIAFYYEIPF